MLICPRCHIALCEHFLTFQWLSAEKLWNYLLLGQKPYLCASVLCLVSLFSMLSTAQLESLGVCLMKYSSVLQRYGTILVFDINCFMLRFELSSFPHLLLLLKCWMKNCAQYNAAWWCCPLYRIVFYYCTLTLMGFLK